MNKKYLQKLKTNKQFVFMFFYVLAALAGFVGYALNIFKLLTTENKILEFGALEILRIFGIIIPPIGAFLGFF